MPQTGFLLRRLPVRPERGQGQTHLGTVADLDSKNPNFVNRTNLSRSSVDVPHRAVNSHRKTGSLGTTPHKAHTEAPQKQLEGPRIRREGDTSSQIAPPASKVVAGGKQCTPRSTITTTKTCSATVYIRVKRRLGCSLK